LFLRPGPHTATPEQLRAMVTAGELEEAYNAAAGLATEELPDSLWSLFAAP
ncbi:MAG: hypothetical protein GWN71_40395, partial [Gammaproteobacteria bacterium]|nr:hypothetical protein [Gemmatimonadota bacterium]NIR41464.1 hypothetical protein [Actinomycetota bacterium]NIU79580.1 hypothetical protein [Gammaproteobacteria bacterium]